MRYNLSIGEQKFELEVGEITEGTVPVEVNGKVYQVVIENFNQQVSNPPSSPPKVTSPVTAGRPQVSRPTMSPPSPTSAPSGGGGLVTAPIPGQILDIKVQVGDVVKAGQTVATMEAMKMENNIVSNIDGTVQEILVQKGAEVASGDAIVLIA